MSVSKQLVTINSRKFDGKIHRSWQAELIEQRDSLLIFMGKFAKEINHTNLGVIRRGTISYEYYWLDRWYNIFQFHEPDGELRNFYCNISQPPKLQQNVLDYIDFDIDILVWKDFSLEILDLEEFDENKKKFKYPAKIINKIQKSVSEIKFLIQKRHFPFDVNDFQINKMPD